MLGLIVALWIRGRLVIPLLRSSGGVLVLWDSPRLIVRSRVKRLIIWARPDTIGRIVLVRSGRIILRWITLVLSRWARVTLAARVRIGIIILRRGRTTRIHWPGNFTHGILRLRRRAVALAQRVRPGVLISHLSADPWVGLRLRLFLGPAARIGLQIGNHIRRESAIRRHPETISTLIISWLHERIIPEIATYICRDDLSPDALSRKEILVQPRRQAHLGRWVRRNRGRWGRADLSRDHRRSPHRPGIRMIGSTGRPVRIQNSGR